ncbi:MAG TPA: hypothetical protein VFX96_14620 [Pyrinomonadaceae bacterium]|nr:hypothetical protein [Pyrinomonadaceae bacterium]
MLNNAGTCEARGRAGALFVAALALLCLATAATLPPSAETNAAASSPRARAVFGARARAASRSRALSRQDGRVDLRLRSFVAGASGQLTVEASLEGGRGRLTALGLPPPESQSRGATTYVVWANSEGRIQRLGELRRDERGNGGLAFTHPAPFDRYTVIVTAERTADAERPAGAPVLSTRANEAAALFPPDAPPATEASEATSTAETTTTTTPPTESNTNTTPTETTPATETPATNTNTASSSETTNTNTSTPSEMTNANTATPPEATNANAATSDTTNAATSTATNSATSDDARTAAPSSSTRPARAPASFRARRAAGGGFYGEVDGALEAAGGGRALVLDGDALAPRAEGQARATERTGSAYVVARFRDVPLPATVNANTYVLWAVVPDGRIVYMGSLPADPTLNRADIYVRVGGFDSDDFDLFVTAEQRRPAVNPSDRRALSTRQPRFVVK